MVQGRPPSRCSPHPPSPVCGYATDISKFLSPLPLSLFGIGLSSAVCIRFLLLLFCFVVVAPVVSGARSPGGLPRVP